ncbi:MAG: hypothetical protein Q8J64_08175 [Thermodesulfovibrionales bacterium]|nr:hypothetical protein [Thermodesulfovibrionales bacterium]
MGTKKLAEAIILQSMEDLWDRHHRAESMEFFFGEGFQTCARMAGMNPTEKLKVLNIAKEMAHASSLPQAAEAPLGGRVSAFTPRYNQPAAVHR